jgi:hypothetical protein
MEREEMEENLRALTAEIRRAGFPESVVADLKRQMDHRTGQDIMLFFQAEVNDRKVFGNLYLEREKAGGAFRFAHFDLDLGMEPVAPIPENSFVRGSGYAVSLQEAVNLMEGRSIYRVPAFDPAGQGYWVSLNRTRPIAGMHLQEYNRSDFNVEVAIRDSQLVRWLDMSAQEKLAGQLRQGDLVKLEVGPKYRRTEVLVEADPAAKDLRVTYPKQKSLIHSEMPSVRSERLAVKHGRSK